MITRVEGAQIGRRWSSRWLIVTAAILVATLAGVNWTLTRQIQLLNDVFKSDTDNVGFSLFQFESDVLRLRYALERALRTGAGDKAALEVLPLRYDIFVSRMDLLRAPRVRESFSALPEYTGALRKSDDFIAFADPWLTEEALPRLTAETLQDAGVRMDALASAIHDLVLRGAGANAAVAEVRSQTIRQQNRMALALSIFQSLVTLAFAVMAMRQFRQQRARREELEALALKLDAARVDAEAGSRAKSEFLATMSHELRTPFNGMLGMLELLGDTRLTAEQQGHLRTATDSAEHLLSILNDVLDASKLEAGQLSMSRQPHELPALIRDAVGLLAASAQSKGLALSLDLPADLPHTVMVDGQRFRQILLNLLSNAIKFTAAGSVEVGVSVQAAGAAPGRLSVSVRDSGIGMDADALGRLFQRFTQADSGISRRFGGTGLGLEISRSLARLMGGDIEASSEPGRGSCFTLRLPLACVLPADDGAPAVRQVPAPPPASPDQAARALDILVAEDQPVNRQVIQGLLERLGHRPRFAENGEEAVRSVRLRRPDLVLMDLHMPVMDGFEAVRCLRADPLVGPSLRIVALSADVLDESRQRALDSGMDAFLTKPVRRGDLAQLLLQMAPCPEVPDAGPAEGPRLAWDDAALAVLDRPRIEELIEDFGTAGYSRIATRLLSDASGSYARLLAAIEAGEPQALKAAAHALKGSAASLGLRAVADMARTLEAAARADEAAHRAQGLRSAWAASAEVCARLGLAQGIEPASAMAVEPRVAVPV